MGEAIEVKISKKDEQDLAPFIDPTPRKPGPTLGDLIARRTAGYQEFKKVYCVNRVATHSGNSGNSGKLREFLS